MKQYLTGWVLTWRRKLHKAPIALLCLLLSLLAAMAQNPGLLADQRPTGTIDLYALNKYAGDSRANCFNFETGTTVTDSVRCDLRYGTLYAGNDFDWLQSSAALGNRSVIKDLGPRLWTTPFKVPIVEPLRKLKPGEQRRISVDTSGADGQQGKPGPPALTPEADGEHVATRLHDPERLDAPARPLRDGRPKIDSLFVKAIPGHMYVIHVVDQTSDFYALFHVDSVERGDKCTISWRKIPAPELQAGKTVE